MNIESIGFVGGGRITRIFLEGWHRSAILPRSIVVSDPDPARLEKISGRYHGITVTADNRQAASCDLVFLAVHPPLLPEVSAGLKESLRPGAAVISLAPKFTLEKLAPLLGENVRLGRCIPNAPSIIGEGFNPISWSAEAGWELRREAAALLEPLGRLVEVEEEKLEAYAVLTAMGPTYLWFQFQALREIGAGFGLTDEEVSTALDAMINGAADTLLSSSLDPSEVLDLIPVKPLAEMEDQVGALYREKLRGIYEKIRP